MKKLLLIMLLAISYSGFAQTSNKGKLDIYVGYGLLTAQDIIQISGTMWSGVLLPGAFDKVDIDGFGAVFAGIDYYLNDRASLGLQVNYAAYDATYKLSSGGDFKIKNTFITPMIHAKANWVNLKYFQLYSAIAAGASFITGVDDNNKKGNSTSFAFQVSPLGLRVGNTFSIFAEGGFGYQGIVSAGVALKL